MINTARPDAVDIKNISGKKSVNTTGVGIELKLSGHVGFLYCQIRFNFSAFPCSTICLSL